MKTCPRTSTSAALVCCAAFVAMVWAVFSCCSAVGRILIFIIFCFVSWFSISCVSWGVYPSLPIHMVGFSSFSLNRMWRFILVVILLMLFVLFFSFLA